jgi:secreted Zn-dependent insulinase-like peptidase
MFWKQLLLKSTKIDEHKRRYEEFREIKDTLFKYQKEKPSIENVQELTVNSRYFNDENLIIGKEICPEFDEKVMKSLVEKLNDRKFILMVSSATSGDLKNNFTYPNPTILFAKISEALAIYLQNS